MALVAVLLALGMGFILFPGSVYRKFPIFFFGILGAVFLIPELYERYIGSFGSDDYIQAANVQVRFDELNYFWGYFERTWGLGFGILSIGQESTNFAAWAAYNMMPGFTGIGVQDIGIFGSIVQFGYVGMAVTLTATAWCIVQFYRIGRSTAFGSRAIGVAGFSFMLAFMLSPWPMDFFTLNWTVFLGWVLIYLAWKCALELHMKSEVF